MSTATSAIAPYTISLTMEQELGVLFNTINIIWHTHPTQFGFKSFDECIKSIPFTYYNLLIHQNQLKLQQQQKQQSKSVNTTANTSAPSSSAIQENQSTLFTSNAKITHIPTKRRKRSCIAAPKLESIDETATFSPSTSSIPSILSAEKKLNALATEFDANLICSDQTNTIKKQQKSTKSYKKDKLFNPVYAARANLNIYIPKRMTKQLLAEIDEIFPNTGTLYYYLDICTALQINDEQVYIIETAEGEEVSFINFDLHKKGTKQVLYAVVIANDENKINGNKWLYKVSQFLTIKEIQYQYDIDIDDLPQSSRLMEDGLYSQWKQQKDDCNNIDISILDEVEWNNIKQIGSSKKGKKAKRNRQISIMLNDQYLINECRKSWNNDNLPLIPIVVYENRDINKHWIEWIKLIYISSQNAYIGISCKYNDDNNKWDVMSIYLDKDDIHNKHRLIGLKYNEENTIDYDTYFDEFNTEITEIEWRL